MAWRPTHLLVEGELDNTTPGRITGTLMFLGKHAPVRLDLRGDFHRDIRGAKVRLLRLSAEDVRKTTPEQIREALDYMDGFKCRQTGNAGDMTAGKPPADYVSTPYFEWYSEANGRVVLELEPGQVEVIGTPIPACESDPISREHQGKLMAGFLTGVAKSVFGQKPSEKGGL